jgi:2-keto-4-pentenoate hydratase/2-oxohepta-3-ene-1,7-dioic acid hydratase in catechol pathway
MASYKLVTYQSSQGPRAGLLVGEQVFDAAELTGQFSYASVLDILNDWRKARGILSDAGAKGGRTKGLPLASTRMRAPVLWPPTIYCAGANYSDHMLEMARALNSEPEPDPHRVGLKPWHFIKASRTLADPGSKVTLPPASKEVDWEAELTAVIGQQAKDVSLENALDYVAGYTVANDLSARDLMRRPPVRPTSPFFSDWVGQKCFDGACPLGPWIVPASDIPDPQNLGIKLWVNDLIKQDSNTSKMIFNLAEQISHLSSRLTLYPGDLVLSGTPSGVGAARKEFLKPGDVVKVWVENVGTLTHTCGSVVGRQGRSKPGARPSIAA